ncbi:MAG: glycosyl transferase [Pseudomonadota bacterium]
MFFRKRKKKDIERIRILVEREVAKRQYQVDAREAKRLTQERRIVDKEIVVSLTTYSKRIHDVYLVIESISQQTVLPNRVVLWLAEGEFDTLPISITERTDFGLEIRFCEDIKSYKKIVPALLDFPDSIIITLDDDILYPKDTIEILVNKHKENPGAIIGHRAHEITYRKGKVRPYKEWKKETKENNGNIFLTGGAGALYPPNSLYKDVTKKEIFTEICPYADDVWMFFMAKLNKTEIINVQGRDFKDFVELSNASSEGGLNKLNVDRRYNDKQIANMIKYYGANI